MILLFTVSDANLDLFEVFFILKSIIIILVLNRRNLRTYIFFYCILICFHNFFRSLEINLSRFINFSSVNFPVSRFIISNLESLLLFFPSCTIRFFGKEKLKLSMFIVLYCDIELIVIIQQIEAVNEENTNMWCNWFYR